MTLLLARRELIIGFARFLGLSSVSRCSVRQKLHRMCTWKSKTIKPEREPKVTHQWGETAFNIDISVLKLNNKYYSMMLNFPGAFSTSSCAILFPFHTVSIYFVSFF
jgi:hypothetical protein